MTSDDDIPGCIGDNLVAGVPTAPGQGGVIEERGTIGAELRHERVPGAILFDAPYLANIRISTL